ncbi:MAG TPA: hypothetical protein VMK65_09955 [Longimicrobiales bacterium]|nr:hypothetical protein [Longimicrobiales bacterium]
MSTTLHADAGARGARFELGWMGSTTAIWALAGGVAGGLMVTALLLAGRMHPGGLMIPVVAVAIFGGVLGTVHGAVLARLGRPEGAPAHLGWREAAGALLAAGGAILLAVLIALWTTLSAAMVTTGRGGGWLLMAGMTAVSLASVGWATLRGWHALERAFTRWPDHRLGSMLVLATFLLLAGLFLSVRPALPGTALQPGPMFLVLAAGIATLWLAAPGIVLMLMLAHRVWGERRSRWLGSPADPGSA